MLPEHIRIRAELSYSQALWYAWGRKDAGQYPDVDVFAFAESVKSKQIAFDTEESFINESIQGQWENFVSGPFALSDCVNWETNVMGDCGGRVERVNGVVICEACRNR